jgi:hypothetical protein
MSDQEIFTADDVAGLNTASVARAAAFARISGSVLVGAGGLGVAAWLWITVRLQVALGGSSGPLDPVAPGTDIGFLRRLDGVAAYIALLVSALLTVGVGLGLRLVADYAVARTGGTLTGYLAGDPLPPPDDDDSTPGLPPPPMGRPLGGGAGTSPAAGAWQTPPGHDRTG